MAAVPIVALRVSQLDAAELDHEIELLTKTQLTKLFKYQQTNFLANYEAEINAGIKLLIWKFSLNAIESTLGQAMLNLKYRNETIPANQGPWISSRQKILYACLFIGCPWLKDRSHDLIELFGMSKWKDKIDRMIKWLETGFKLATLINFLVFLCKGSYLTLLERLVGIRSVFPHKQGMRQVTFEYMTRELLWHGFSELLFFIVPLVNFQRIKNFVIQKLLSSSASKSSQMLPAERNLTSCAICSDWPIRAQEIGCHHVFCHYCIHSNYAADPSFACPICTYRVNNIENIRPVSIINNGDNDDDNDDVDDS
ncbi:peroxisome assembly protein (Peroxin-2) [Mactra antiquata]